MITKHFVTHWVICRARKTIGDTLRNEKVYAHADAKADTVAKTKKSETI